MDFEGLTPEQVERAKNCKSVAELVELAKNEGVEITDEQLNAIASGGIGCWCHESLSDGCKKCGSHDIKVGNIGQIMKYTCKSCGYSWM